MSQAQQTAVDWMTALRTVSSGPCPGTVLWAAAVTTAAPATPTLPYSTSQRQVAILRRCVDLTHTLQNMRGSNSDAWNALGVGMFLVNLSPSLSIREFLTCAPPSLCRICRFGESGHDLLLEQFTADPVHDSRV